MTHQQAFVFAILGLALVLFAWGRWRYDLVALSAMVAVVVSGIVPAGDALEGFGHPAVITVAAVLVISRALRNSGVVDLIAGRLMPYTENIVMHIGGLTATVTLASAFMNNVGALALMLPVALATAEKRQRSPALVLMPLAFGSILGGLITLIGTPPNIIIASYRAEHIGEPFGMFDFAPVGGVVALLGLLFVALIGWRLVPRERQAIASTAEKFQINDYLMEVRLTKDSDFVGQRIGEIEALRSNEVVPVALVRGDTHNVNPSPWRTLQAGDLLVVRADASTVKILIDEHHLELVASKASGLQGLKLEDLKLVEVMVKPGSALVGRGTDFLRTRAHRTLSLVAMARQGAAVSSRLRQVRFQIGDVLLVQGDADTVDDALLDLGLLPLAERDLQIIQPRRVGIAVGIFGSALAASALGVVPVTIAFIITILAFVLLDILPARDLYRDIDWPTIVLLGGMLSLGQALETTGGAELIADTIVAATAGLSVMLVLALVLTVTMCLSDVINNAATALVMAPIAVGIATRLGVNADPFLMAVALGASCAFLTPIGHQSNTLVMGPGGYRFGDYWRMGLPLEILIVIVATPLLIVVWPL